MEYLVLIKSSIDTDELREDLEELDNVRTNQVDPIEEKIRDKIERKSELTGNEDPIDLLQDPPESKEQGAFWDGIEATMTAPLPFEKWLATQYGDELDIMKKIATMKGINLTQAQTHIPSFPSPPIVGDKFIPDLVKEMRMIRRELKGEQRNKITKAVNHLITAYE